MRKESKGKTRRDRTGLGSHANISLDPSKKKKKKICLILCADFNDIAFGLKINMCSWAGLDQSPILQFTF